MHVLLGTNDTGTIVQKPIAEILVRELVFKAFLFTLFHFKGAI